MVGGSCLPILFSRALQRSSREPSSRLPALPYGSLTRSPPGGFATDRALFPSGRIEEDDPQRGTAAGVDYERALDGGADGRAKQTGDIVSVPHQLIRRHHLPREISIESRLTLIDGHQERSRLLVAGGDLDLVDDLGPL